MKAAVMRAYNAPLELEEVQIDDPGPGEVLVKTAASGICHSDLTVIEGGLPMPPPCILGHEPAGTVEALGDALDEENETIIADITAATNATEATAQQATATITDNDTATADLAVTTQGDETGPVDIVYTVTLSTANDTGAAITFDLDDVGTGTATAGADYTAIPANALGSPGRNARVVRYCASASSPSPQR